MKVLSLGSLNLDHVYNVEHIVRPGETVSCNSLNIFCGGKGLNQSIALARAGAEVYHAGKMGTDGARLSERLKADGVDVSFIGIEKDMPTGHAVIQVENHGQNCIVIFPGANSCVSPEYIDGIMDNFEAGDLLLMQNEVSNLDYALKKAHEKGMIIALNPSPISAALISSDALEYVDWFILNEIEGYQLTGENTAEKICRALREKYLRCKVVLTLGEQGSIYFDGENFAAQGIYKVAAVDTTAAGDTFTGYFLSCVMEGMAPEKALSMAAKASAIAVSRPGAADSIPLREETENFDISARS